MKEQLREGSVVCLSASKVKTYSQCPRKYYYSYIEKLPKKKWDHFDLGTLCHGALENFHRKYHNDNQEFDLQELMTESFKKAYDKMRSEGTEVSADIVKQAKTLLNNYLRKIKINKIGSDIIQVENEFELPLNEKYNVQGIVDRIDLDRDGIYHIKDYKTNKSDAYMESDQLIIYGIYLLNKKPEIEKFRGSYIMLKLDGSLVKYEFTREDVKKITRKLIEYADCINEEERWIEGPSTLCSYCDFNEKCNNTWS
jgi:RecB family exonuclease